MKGKSVLALIVVLMCCGLSLGNGEKSALRSLHRYYCHLMPYLKNPNALLKVSAIYRHLKEVNEAETIWQNWLQKHTGYSFEQLNSPPGSFMTENELKVATEYHLCLSGWYHVRFITLDRAAKRDNHLEDRYPHIDQCKNAALKAMKISENHKNLYKLYYQALGEEAKLNIVKEIEIPNSADPEKQNHQNIENDAILSVRVFLERRIARLVRRKTYRGSSTVKKDPSIRVLMAPSGMSLKENFLSKIRNFFPVEDLSLSPDKASRKDREFLEVAWLLNRYRSLWYKKRHNDFSKFLRHNKQGLKAEFIQRVEEAIQFTNSLFQKCDLLYKDYKELWVNQPASIVVDQNNPSLLDLMNVNRRTLISQDDRHEKLQWRCRRKRAALHKVRNLKTVEYDEAAENQSMDENLQSDSPVVHVPAILELVPSSKRYKCLEAGIQTGHQAKQQKPSDGEGRSHFNCPTAHLCNEDSDLRLGATFDQVGTDDDMAMEPIPYTDAFWSHQPYLWTTNEKPLLETDGVIKVYPHEITPNVFHGPELETDFSHDPWRKTFWRPCSKQLRRAYAHHCRIEFNHKV